MDELSKKLNDSFARRVVHKDLTKKIKEGANVPVYVLEYLLGMYCATDDEESISEGVDRVKKILAENFVRPDEAEKVKSKIRELGKYTVIDKPSLTPIQMPNLDLNEIMEGRKDFTKEEWIDVLIRRTSKMAYATSYGTTC